MFIRSNIPFMRAKRLENFIGIECVRGCASKIVELLDDFC